MYDVIHVPLAVEVCQYGLLWGCLRQNLPFAELKVNCGMRVEESVPRAGGCPNSGRLQFSTPQIGIHCRTVIVAGGILCGNIVRH